MKARTELNRIVIDHKFNLNKTRTKLSTAISKHNLILINKTPTICKQSKRLKYLKANLEFTRQIINKALISRVNMIWV